VRGNPIYGITFKGMAGHTAEALIVKINLFSLIKNASYK